MTIKIELEFNELNDLIAMYVDTHLMQSMYRRSADELREENESLKAEVENLKGEVSSMRNDNREYRDRSIDLQNEIDDLCERNTELSALQNCSPLDRPSLSEMKELLDLALALEYHADEFPCDPDLRMWVDMVKRVRAIVGPDVGLKYIKDMVWSIFPHYDTKKG